MTIGKGHHLYLIDGSAYIFRAYHALPPLTRPSDGLPVGAVAGFCGMLHKMMTGFGTKGPTHLAVIFDHSATSFRKSSRARTAARFLSRFTSSAMAR